MKTLIPLYVEKFRADSGTQYFVRPLFHPHPDASREELKRATDSVAGQLRRRISTLAAEPRHEELSALLFSPRLTEERARVEFNLRRRTFRGDYLFAIYEALGRRVAFTPRLPDLHFTLERGDSLRERAAEVLGAHYRRLERDEVDFDPAWHTARGDAWLSQIELNLEVEGLARKAGPQGRESLESFQSQSGATELARVGRNLCDGWPENLAGAVLRDREVAEIVRLLWSRDTRPLLLAGRQGSGKTALIHEALRRALDSGVVSQGGARQLWLISPQRLISGMSFVGQWETRLNSILTECRRKRHILYFDDFLGLFRAGQSSSSRLSVAQVLRPHVERQEVRILAELTPEALHALKELDRGWADLFHVLPVEEPAESDNWRILLQWQRELEARHGTRFEPDALPTVVDLVTRYRREEAMPGKAAGFLAQLALKHRNARVDRADVLREFEARSGLSVTFLDEQAELPRDRIVAGIRKSVMGQQAAVEALADVVSIAKARLNDPERPLGTLLFLGPTGTGKTQCAKALAAWMYGNEASLLRFDMNEFVDAHAVARLAGTLEEPEGLLTSAVRRRPFATILLDEIEKAHPAAFDLLLQVLGEGRLTDALGRTTDFTNCVIILTSNLGAQQADGGLGFSGHQVRDAAAYVSAAKAFFRPEFFNRLDYVIPFGHLAREQVADIARGLIRGVLQREGLSRRLCALQVEPAAMDAVVEFGYHPTLGARAIRRAIEARLTRPLSVQLAALATDVPTLLRVGAACGDIQVQVLPLSPAKAGPDCCASLDYSQLDIVVARIDGVLNQAEAWLQQERPAGAISGREISPGQRRYFAVRHAFDWLDQAVERLVAGAQATREKPLPDAEDGAAARLRERRRAPAEVEWDRLPLDSWRQLRDEAELRAATNPQNQDPAAWETEDRLRFLAACAAQLQLLLSQPAVDQRAVVVCSTLDGKSHPVAAAHAASLEALARMRFELNVQRLDAPGPGAIAVCVEGPIAMPLLRPEAGMVLLWQHGELSLLQVNVLPLEPGDDPAVVARMPGAGGPGPVIRVWIGSRCLDVRTGILARGRPPLGLLQIWAAGDLPLGNQP